MKQLREKNGGCIIILMIMYIYHVLINALHAHMIHINLNTTFYTHVEHSPTKTVDIRYHMETHTRYEVMLNVLRCRLTY